MFRCGSSVLGGLRNLLRFDLALKRMILSNIVSIVDVVLKYYKNVRFFNKGL